MEMGGGVLKVGVGLLAGALMLLGTSLYLSDRALDAQSQSAKDGDLAGAAAQAERAATLDPFGATPLASRGYLELRRDQPEDALRAFEEARDRDPANYANYVAVGNVQRQHLGQPEAAVESYRAAVERNPNAETVRPLLGQTLLEVGDVQGAIKQYEWFLEKERGSSSERYVLGRLYLRANEPEKGFEIFSSVRDQAAAGLEGLSGEERGTQEQFVESLDLAIADALVLQRDFDGAREVLEASGSEQAPSILALLNQNPERYRESVTRARVG